VPGTVGRQVEAYESYRVQLFWIVQLSNCDSRVDLDICLFSMEGGDGTIMEPFGIGSLKWDEIFSQKPSN
jgi:hypothetical protein